MKVEEILDELNNLVWSERKDPLKNNKLLELVIKRNEILHKDFEPPPFNQIAEKQYENYCEFLDHSTKIPKEFRAYHSGPSMQSELINTRKTFEDYSIHNHIYFSLNPEEIVRNYLDDYYQKNNAIYVIDLKSVSNARVQTSYSSEVLWSDKIRTLIECYKDEEYMEKLLKERNIYDRIYIEPFKYKPKEELKKAAIKEIEIWLSRYTIPFKLKHLKRYKRKKQNFILIPQPIKVIYY